MLAPYLYFRLAQVVCSLYYHFRYLFGRSENETGSHSPPDLGVGYCYLSFFPGWSDCSHFPGFGYPGTLRGDYPACYSEFQKRMFVLIYLKVEANDCLFVTSYDYCSWKTVLKPVCFVWVDSVFSMGEKRCFVLGTSLSLMTGWSGELDFHRCWIADYYERFGLHVVVDHHDCDFYPGCCFGHYADYPDRPHERSGYFLYDSVHLTAWVSLAFHLTRQIETL